MQFSREWAMPNSRTFSIPPISQIIHRYIDDVLVVGGGNFRPIC